MKTRIKIDCPYDFLDHGFLSEVELSDDPEVILVNPGTEEFLDKEYFKSYESLKVVGTPSTGVNHIDTEYLESRNIKVFCLLDDKPALESISASAEFTWLHIMNLVRKFELATCNTLNWRDDSNEAYLRSNELDNKKIGIIGLGRIGRRIKRYAEAFNMSVKYYDPYVDGGVDSIQDLSDVDILSINCYLTSETTNLISNGILDDFKDGLVVVNTARGEVVDEDYIYELITSNKIIFGCDVLKNEQNIEQLKESKLMSLYLKGEKNIVITPHVAGATVESQQKAFNSIFRLCMKSL